MIAEPEKAVKSAVTGTIALSEMLTGQSGTVLAIEGGVQLRTRMVGMGMRVGSHIEMAKANRGKHGPLLVAVGSTRIGIGRGMAEKIRIQLTSK